MVWWRRIDLQVVGQFVSFSLVVKYFKGKVAQILIILPTDENRNFWMEIVKQTGNHTLHFTWNTLN